MWDTNIKVSSYNMICKLAFSLDVLLNTGNLRQISTSKKQKQKTNEMKELTS